MKTHAPASTREEELEEALRGLCNHLTKLQQRAALFLPDGNPDDYISDTLELLDGPEQHRVQKAARVLLNEPYVQIPLRRS